MRREVYALRIFLDARYPLIVEEAIAAVALVLNRPSDWQREICARFPDRLLRGLIHSDGCRSINTIRHPKETYRYPRYEFTNRSDDIRGIFCEYCDKVGVDWRVMNRWNISVARRESVATLDRLIGPKR